MFRELEWKTPIFSWRAAPKIPSASCQPGRALRQVVALLLHLVAAVADRRLELDVRPWCIARPTFSGPHGDCMVALKTPPPSFAPASVSKRSSTCGDHSVSSRRSYSRVKGPGTSAGAFPRALSHLERFQGVLGGVRRDPVGPRGPLETAALLPHRSQPLQRDQRHRALRPRRP